MNCLQFLTQIVVIWGLRLCRFDLGFIYTIIFGLVDVNTYAFFSMYGAKTIDQMLKNTEINVKMVSFAILTP